MNRATASACACVEAAHEHTGDAVAVYPADHMRRSYAGLAAMVRGHLGVDPLSGQGFVFVNRRRAQPKCLYFEAGECCVWSKRLRVLRD